MDEMLGTLLNIINGSLSVCAVYLFFSALTAFRLDKWVRLVFGVIFSLVYILVLEKTDDGVLRSIFIFLTVVLISLMFEMKAYNRILFPLIFIAVNMASVFFTEAVWKIIFYSVSENNSLDGIFIILISRVLLFVILFIWRMKKHKILTNTPSKFFMVLALIPLSTVGMIIFIYRFFSEISTMSDEIRIGVLIFSTMLIISNSVIFYFIDIVEENNESSYAVYAANKLIEQKTEQYEELLSSQEKIMKLHHDYKKVFVGLVSSIDESNIEKTKRELMRQYKELTELSAPVQDDNIVRIILNMKQRVMDQNYIVAQMEYKELYKNRISPIDTAIIFGNALDNAIEACMEFPLENKKIIEIYGEVKNNIIVFTIKNPVIKNIDTKNLRTTKDSFGHGYGIISMKNIAEKYGGDVIFECKDKIFTTYIMLRNEPSGNR